MITIPALSQKNTIVFQDLFDIYDEYRCQMTKRDTKQIIIFNFTSIITLNRYTNFIFTDVLKINENLALGLVALSIWPGEWDFELQGKMFADINYTTTYIDLARVLDPNQKYQSI